MHMCEDTACSKKNKITGAFFHIMSRVCQISADSETLEKS